MEGNLLGMISSSWRFAEKDTQINLGEFQTQVECLEMMLSETICKVKLTSPKWTKPLRGSLTTMNKPTYAYLNGKVVEVIKQEDNGTFLIKSDERLYWVEAHELKHIKL